MLGIQLVIFLCLVTIEAAFNHGGHKRFPKPIDKGIILDDNEEDRKPEGTRFHYFGGFDGESGGEGGGGNYFLFQHVPKKDHYEFGYKKGNEHHVRERHENAHPHSGHFKTKVKWGDKHGGHGEHYWDYNHHGSSEAVGQGEEDEATDRVNRYRTPDDEATVGGDHEGRIGIEPVTFFQKEPFLVYNLEAKTVTDENTGKLYMLYPIEYAPTPA